MLGPWEVEVSPHSAGLQPSWPGSHPDTRQPPSPHLSSRQDQICTGSIPREEQRKSERENERERGSSRGKRVIFSLKWKRQLISVSTLCLPCAARAWTHCLLCTQSELWTQHLPSVESQHSLFCVRIQHLNTSAVGAIRIWTQYSLWAVSFSHLTL